MSCRNFGGKFGYFGKVEKVTVKKQTKTKCKRINRKKLYLNNDIIHKLVLDIATNNKNTQQALLTGTGKKLKM